MGTRRTSLSGGVFHISTPDLRLVLYNEKIGSKAYGQKHRHYEHAAKAMVRRQTDDDRSCIGVFQHADNAFKYFLQGIDDTPTVNHALWSNVINIFLFQ